MLLFHAFSNFLLTFKHLNFTMRTNIMQTLYTQGALLQEQASLAKTVPCSLNPIMRVFRDQVQPILCAHPLLMSMTIAQEYLRVQLVRITWIICHLYMLLMDRKTFLSTHYCCYNSIFWTGALIRGYMSHN